MLAHALGALCLLTACVALYHRSPQLRTALWSWGATNKWALPLAMTPRGLLAAALALATLLAAAAVVWTLSHVLVYVQALSAVATTLGSVATGAVPLGALFEYKLPRSALLVVHDVYATTVANVGRHHQIDPASGRMVRSGFDVSTNMEFTLIWSRMAASGYLANATSLYERVVVDVGAM